MSEGDRPATARNATRADEPAMLEFLFGAFQRWPAFQIEVPAIEHLRWKMQSHPMHRGTSGSPRPTGGSSP
jgi:hypothetical protein